MVSKKYIENIRNVTYQALISGIKPSYFGNMSCENLFYFKDLENIHLFKENKDNDTFLLQFNSLETLRKYLIKIENELSLFNLPTELEYYLWKISLAEDIKSVHTEIGILMGFPVLATLKFNNNDDWPKYSFTANPFFFTCKDDETLEYSKNFILNYHKDGLLRLGIKQIDIREQSEILQKTNISQEIIFL